MLFLLSLIAWAFLLFITNQGPRCSIPWIVRGGGGGSPTTTSHTFYYYKIKLAHGSIDPSQSIILYNSIGEVIYTIPPYTSAVDYGTGIISVPGTEQNTAIEDCANATYYVFYSADDMIIDYGNAEFKLAKKLVRSPSESVVRATFEYYTVFTPLKDVASVIDGRFDTQVQTEFFAEPLRGYRYAILDLGAVRTIQALDITAGFYKPDEARKYDVNMNFTLQYSLDNVTYYDVSSKTNNFNLTGGKSKQFEEDDLGIGFQARYLLLKIEKIDYIEFKTGVWVVALTEVSAYDDIVIKSDAKLIPTTALTTGFDAVSGGANPTEIYVTDTTGFSEPSSGGDRETAFIQNTDGTLDSFTYNGVTATTFTGVLGLSNDHDAGALVVQEEETDTTLYDYYGLLPHLQDRVYKKNKTSDTTLYTQTQLDYLAKSYLREFVKNHTKVEVDVLYSPHIQVGQTIHIVDASNDIDDNYFVEAIKDTNGMCTLTLARYPA